MDPILLLLGVDVAAMALLAAPMVPLPPAARALLASASCAVGLLMCLPALLLRLAPMTFGLPAGPPGLSLHFALDPLALCFLITLFLTGPAILLFAIRTVPVEMAVTIQPAICCLAGAAVALLAADAVSLTLAVAVACGAVWRPWSQGWSRGLRTPTAALIPLLLLTAICLLTPAGFEPRFDTIRASPVEPHPATAAAMLTVAAAVGLAVGASRTGCWIRDALVAGALFPVASYLLLRILVDLPGSVTPGGWGLALLLIGSAVAVIEGWRSAADRDIDGAVACLVRRQIGLAMTGVGLTLVARSADLPEAASFAMAATLLSVVGGSVAGLLTALAAHALGSSAGSFRLARLGGLAHTMPVTSAAFGMGLLGLGAVPPSAGFASMWLLFSAILSAPRGGGLLPQLPLALGSAAIALSAALSTTASVRLIGIAILGRPRTPRGSGARESAAPVRTILLVMSGLSALMGVLPGPALWILADPVLEALADGPPGTRIGLALLWNFPAEPGYLALPLVALLALATWGVLSGSRWSGREVKPAGVWADGMPPPPGLPFGEPHAQSVGAGFLPELPKCGARLVQRLLPLRPVRLWQLWRPTSAAMLWLLLAAFGALLLALAATR